MKLLLDQNLSYRLLDRLDAIYPGSTQVRLAGMAAASDAALWQFAFVQDTENACLELY